MKINKRILTALVVVILIIIGGLIYIYEFSTPQEKENRIQNNSNSTSTQSTTSSFFYTVGKLRIAKTSDIEIQDGFRSVSLCGGHYKARRIFIDGAEILPRISRILSEDRQQEVALCRIWRARALNRGGQAPNEEELYMTIGGKNGEYELDISISIDKPKADFPLFIKVKENSITNIDGGFIGDLRVPKN